MQIPFQSEIQVHLGLLDELHSFPGQNRRCVIFTLELGLEEMIEKVLGQTSELRGCRFPGLTLVRGWSRAEFKKEMSN